MQSRDKHQSTLESPTTRREIGFYVLGEDGGEKTEQ